MSCSWKVFQTHWYAWFIFSGELKVPCFILRTPFYTPLSDQVPEELYLQVDACSAEIVQWTSQATSTLIPILVFRGLGGGLCLYGVQIQPRRVAVVNRMHLSPEGTNDLARKLKTAFLHQSAFSLLKRSNLSWTHFLWIVNLWTAAFDHFCRSGMLLLCSITVSFKSLE